MTNEAFYAFCKEQRKTEPDQHKREVLQSVYGFMWECGISKEGVNTFIERRIFHYKGQSELVKAYEWLRDVFAGKVSIAESTQETLF